MAEPQLRWELDDAPSPQASLFGDLVERQIGRGEFRGMEFLCVRAKSVINAELEELTGKALAQRTIDRAFSQIELTEDPVAGSLRRSAENAFATGLVPEADLTGIYDLSLLRKVLGRDVDDAGLGSDGAGR